LALGILVGEKWKFWKLFMALQQKINKISTESSSKASKEWQRINFKFKEIHSSKSS